LNQADAVIFQTEKQLQELGDKIPADKKAAIQAAVDKLKEAHKNKDVDAIEPAIKEIETRFGEAQQDILNAQAQAQAGANPGAGAAPSSDAGTDHVTDVDFEEVK
ncbi:MAG: Hsp70 family protein, partial [Muribaculaceae bacterium]|nr:Hsp70 family protein [Muribaculaceae bacterium]